ncbi:MAG: hypothetical protein ACRETH_03515 [Steroidobacteraceae bacterium]
MKTVTHIKLSRYRTFADILNDNRFSNYGGSVCRFCKNWRRETAYYAVRHVVCRQCCEERANQVLPSVLKAKAKTRRGAIAKAVQS